MHINHLLLVAGAAVVSAHPSPHGHARLHDKRDVVMHIETVTEYKTVTEGEPAPATFYEKPTTTSTSTTPVVPTTTSTSTTTTAPKPTTPTTTSTAAAATSAKASSTSTSSSSNSGSAHTYTDFKCSSSKRATDAQIAYAGNVGTPYGCNMMMVDSGIADQYTYSVDFVNKASETYAVCCWNKYGNDGLLDGWYEGKGLPISFTIGAGQTQAVAFQPNSQGACTVSPGSCELVTKSGTNPNGGYYETGAYAGSWLEWDWGNGSNGGWSGFDVSVLLAQRNGMSVYGLSACSSDCSGTCSSITSGGTSNNAYVMGMEAVDGTGGNCPESKIKITATIG